MACGTMQLPVSRCTPPPLAAPSRRPAPHLPLLQPLEHLVPAAAGLGGCVDRLLAVLLDPAFHLVWLGRLAALLLPHQPPLSGRPLSPGRTGLLAFLDLLPRLRFFFFGLGSSSSSSDSSNSLSDASAWLALSSSW